MSDSFTETTILECNRLSSEEGKTNSNQNPALFTNKVGSGIKVNQGDTVSVFSAFVSEKGAGGETIQFNGRTITDKLGNPITYQLSSTALNKTNACFMIPIANNDEIAVIRGNPLRIRASNSSNTYTLKDNEVNIKICYYKTINGEGCVALPRRFMSSIPGINETRNTQWKMEDSFEQGQVHRGIFEEGGGVPVLLGRSPGGINTSFTQRFFVDDDYRFKEQASTSTDSASNREHCYYKLKTDNSRYKIFVSKETRKGGYISGISDSDMDWFIYDEPSEQDFIPYEEVLKLSAPVGFSSPDTIANTLTDQLRETGAIQENYFYNLNGSKLPGGISNSFEPQYIKRNVSTFNESKTYKTFEAFSVNDSNASTYYAFENACFSQAGGGSRFYYNQYLQSYQFIGIKRPDFYEKGLELQKTMPKFSFSGSSNGYCNLDLDINTTVAGSNPRLSGSLILDHEWTTDNLNAWKGWLDTQGNYPELFYNTNNVYQGRTTVNNSRFFHMNLNEKQLDKLGGDNNFSVNFDAKGFATKNASSYNSVPVFFDFDPSASNTFTNGEDGNACYGFAYKKYNPNTQKYNIGFSQTKINTAIYWDFVGNIEYQVAGIPTAYSYYSGSHSASGYAHDIIVGNWKSNASGENRYESGSGASNNASGRLCGFDRHFNAFGNSMIGLADGYLNSNYSQTNYFGINTFENDKLKLSNAVIDATPFAKKIYIGAQEPKFEFSASNQKFNIQQLHTPEYIGNLWNAGIVSASAELNTTANPEAQDKVYKINKRLNNTNWTTDMLPYSQNNVSKVESIYPGGIGANAQFSLSLKNDMIEPWKVFDAQSGIFITDMGVPDNYWEQSLWATLGFSTTQFSGSLNASYNYNTILNETNKSNTPVLFTNADLNVGDTINYVKNVWGAPLITSQVPLPMLFNGETTASPPFIPERFFQIYPAISEKQSSILIEAENLPTKMSRAYYTIRSNLLDTSHYLGSRDSGEALKTISVVNKINGDGDYYFQQDNPLTFTITHPKTITSITTQICDPDGSDAQVNLDSCVMYKIDRAINSTLNPVDELLQATNNKNNNIKK